MDNDVHRLFVILVCVVILLVAANAFVFFAVIGLGLVTAAGLAVIPESSATDRPHQPS